MIARLFLLVCSILLSCSASAQGPLAKKSQIYDGHWAVELTCPDTKDKSGFIKGYRYTFSAIVEAGKLNGQFGITGTPNSVIYTGTVSEDGTLKMTGVGRSGNPTYSAGQVATGTSYSYTLLGKLDGVTGQATRLEVRPCTAKFAKQ